MIFGVAPMPFIMRRPATRNWRYRYFDCARISGSFTLGPAEVSALSAPTGHVRNWTGLPFSPAAPPAGWLYAQWLAALGQHHAHQPRGRADRRHARVVDRPQSVSDGASPDHAACGPGRCLAVLCTASIRAHGMGPRREMVSAQC